MPSILTTRHSSSEDYSPTPRVEMVVSQENDEIIFIGTGFINETLFAEAVCSRFLLSDRRGSYYESRDLVAMVSTKTVVYPTQAGDKVFQAHVPYASLPKRLEQKYI